MNCHQIENVKQGDIVLYSGNSFHSNMIKLMTKNIFSHVGFIVEILTSENKLDNLYVLESIENVGVRIIPLSYYIFGGNPFSYDGESKFARHKKSDIDIVKGRKFAFSKLGCEYDDNKIFKIGEALMFKKTDMYPKLNSSEIEPDYKFICSQYVAEIYESMGIKIAHHKLDEKGKVIKITDNEIQLPYDFDPAICSDFEYVY